MFEFAQRLVVQRHIDTGEDIDSELILLYKRAFDEFKYKNGIIFTWESNYYETFKSDSLMSLVKVSKSQQSLSTTELFFHSTRCYTLHVAEDDLLNFAKFLEQYQQALEYDNLILEQIQMFLRELLMSSPRDYILESSCIQFNDLLDRYEKIMREMLILFPNSTKVLHLFGTFKTDILMDPSGHVHCDRVHKVMKTMRTN
jgi:hypothetical protein